MNRIVVEVVNGTVEKVLADRPDEVMVLINDLMSREICQWYGEKYKPLVFGEGGLPIEPLPIEHTAVGVTGGPVEVEFEVEI